MSKYALRWIELVETTAVFVFFYQALQVLFSVLFGLIYDALFAETASLTAVGLLLVVVILALCTPWAAPRRPSARRMALLVGAVLVFTARIALTFDEPTARLVASIAIVGGAGLYLAARLQAGPRDVSRALIAALVIDQVLRAAGHTFDVTLQPQWWPGQVAVSLALCLLSGWLSRRRPTEESTTGFDLGLQGGLRGVASTVAWGDWLFLEMSLLAFPNAIVRWSGVPESSYWIVSTLVLAITLAPLLERNRLPWNRLEAVASLALLPLLAAGNLLRGAVAVLALLLAQWLALRLLFVILAPPESGHDRRPGSGLAVGNVVFLLLTFVYAFAFTYAYTLDLFRGAGLPTILVAGFLAVLPALQRQAHVASAITSGTRGWAPWATGVGLLILVIFLTWPQPPRRPADGSLLRAATYNMHYGYDTFWHLSLEAQAQTMKASGADVIALQEVDVGRPTSYMIDDALWLAHRLGMEVVYFPCVEQLTGIALLSRYPIVDSAGQLLPSNLEQTGIVEARLDVAGTTVHAFAIWMGLEPEERTRQLDAALPFLAAHPGPTLFGGDFNSTPDSAVYARIAAAGFVDPFVALGLGSPPTDPAIEPGERIDFVWLRDLTPLAARVPDSLASDHRPVVIEASLP
jgi:endonuclease/exonuclease/phosphatase family metal-dependent hydrolase